MGKIDYVLRVLIAGACIAVIAGVGYYLLGEYRTHEREKAEALQARIDARLREDCVEEMAKLNLAFGISPTEKTKIANCLSIGALSEAEVADRERVLGVSLRKISK